MKSFKSRFINLIVLLLLACNVHAQSIGSPGSTVVDLGKFAIKKKDTVTALPTYMAVFKGDTVVTYRIDSLLNHTGSGSGTSILTELGLQTPLVWINDSTIGITLADATHAGYISSADWNTFNNKQPLTTFKTNGTNNGSQATLNLANGIGITQTDNGTGTVTTKADTAYLNTLYSNNGTDTSFTGITVDSTGQAQNRVLFGIGRNHIGSSFKFVFDSTVHKLVINNKNVSFGGSANKLAVQGGIYSDNAITGNSFVKIGGTSSQFLKADGSVDPNTYLQTYTETDPLSIHTGASAGGDLTGTYPNPTVNTINSITKSYYDPTSSIQTQLNGKQATLVSGTNIKTVNGNSLLGSGDLTVSGGGSSISNAINSGKRLLNATKDSLNTLYGTPGNGFDSTTNSKGLTLQIKGVPLADSAVTGTAIWWWGASVTGGSSATSGLEYAAYVTKSLNLTNNDKGLTGTTFSKSTNGDSSFVDRWNHNSIPAYSSSIRYIVIGGDYAINELDLGKSFQQFQDTLSAYIDSLILNKGYPLSSIVLTTANPIGFNLYSKTDDSLTRWNNAIISIAATKKVLLVDMHSYMYNNGYKLLVSSDSIHPTTVGHFQMYKALVATLAGGVVSNSSIFANGFVHLGLNSQMQGIFRWTDNSNSIREKWFDGGSSTTSGVAYLAASGRTVIWSRPSLELLFENGGNQLSTTTSNCAFGVSSSGGFFTNKVTGTLPFNNATGWQLTGAANQNGLYHYATNGTEMLVGRSDVSNGLFILCGDPTSATSSTAQIVVDVNRIIINKAWNLPYVAKTSTYSIGASDHDIEVTSGTSTYTLPSAVSNSGREYWITNSGSGTTTLSTSSSQTFVNVSGTPTTLTIAQFSAYRVVSNGANWIAFKIVN